MPRHTLHKSPRPQTEYWPPEWPNEPFNNESPRDVYRASCASIALALQPIGFKYLKSKQLCVRDKGDFRYDVHFQSSRHNVAGMHVQLWMHATVSSEAIKEWRSQRLPKELAIPYIAGGMVHRLSDKFALVQWELANPNDREETIQDAITFIQNEVFPYFAQFEDVQSLLTNLTEREIPAFDLIPAIEFAYVFGTHEQAQAILDQFFRKHPDLHRSISEQVSSIPVEPWCYAGNLAKQVAFITRHCNLKLR